MANEKPFIWLIDCAWPDHSLELEILKKELPDVEIKLTWGDAMEADYEAFGRHADAIIVQIDYTVDQKFIDGLTNCRGIAVYGSGFNNVDVAAANAKGISVTNVNGYCAEDLADYILAAIFHYNKRIDELFECVKIGEWDTKALHSPFHRLSNETLLLLGCGWIGRVVAEKAKAVGLNVLIFDEYISDEQIRSYGFEPTTLDEGLAKADYVSIHLRLSEKTEGFFNMDLMKKMKKGAKLLNVSRGPIINEADLIAALNDGTLAGATVDVVCNEPLPMDDPIRQAPNLIITPHLSYASEEATVELRTRATMNAIAMFKGETPRDLVRL